MISYPQFGGQWTQEKLEMIRKYLEAYMTIFKRNKKAQLFTTVYGDAFAGSGYLQLQSQEETELFAELRQEDNQQFLRGSAQIALSLSKPFDKYLFIEKNPRHAQHLSNLREQFLGRDITIRQGDANEVLNQWISTIDWQKTRAVVFLDPYGMQVEWQLLENIAQTKAIDLWLLFPLGVAVNRLLTKDRKPPEVWRHTLTRFFGTGEWEDRFYRRQTDMFGDEIVSKTGDYKEIERFFIERLKTIFAAVAENPRVLKNSHNSPLYLLCFAVGNEKGAQAALKIANHILSHKP